MIQAVNRYVCWLVRPLFNRKVRVALATVLAAYAGQVGLGWDEQMILTVLSVGVALILGIAHEDSGAKSGAGGDSAAPPEPPVPAPQKPAQS